MQPSFFCLTRNRRAILRVAFCAMFATGCADDNVGSAPTLTSAQNEAVTTSNESTSKAVQPKSASANDSKQQSEKQDETFEFKPLTLNNLAGGAGRSGLQEGSAADAEKQIQAIITQLQPLQILLGQWRGTTRREFENFKAVDNHEWVWDLRTDPKRPSLTINSDKSPYLRTGRLSWDSAQKQFTLAATDSAGTLRKFIGDFTETVHEVVGSDDKLHRVFRLEFNQEETPEAANGEMWQLAFAQQENNRYLLEVSRRRGAAAFVRHDTVSTQREGTSFAVSDAGYAEKTCIISEGLGTMELTYKGRSYWVCCTGCKAAFEEEPEKWIARAASRDKK